MLRNRNKSLEIIRIREKSHRRKRDTDSERRLPEKTQRKRHGQKNVKIFV